MPKSARPVNSPTLKEMAMHNALGDVLSGWGDLSYAQVITIFENAVENECSIYDLHDDLVIFERYEDYEMSSICKIIQSKFESNYALYMAIYNHDYHLK